MQRLASWALLCAAGLSPALYEFAVAQQTAAQPTTAQPAPSPIQVASEQDRQRLMDILQIKSLRLGPQSRPEPQPGRLGLVNYDESKANPYPDLPDPLILKNGKKVTSAK